MTTEQEKIIYPDTVTIADDYVEIRPDPKRYNIPQEVLDRVYTDTMWTLYAESARERPTTDFLGVRKYDKEKKAFEDHYTFMKYEEGFKLTEKAGYGFNELGIQPGDIVNECCKNRPEWVIAEYGVIRQAGAVVPLRVEMGNDYYEPIVLDNSPKSAFIDPEKVEVFLELFSLIKEHGHELSYKSIIVLPYFEGPKFGDETLTAEQIERAKSFGVRMLKWEDFLEIGKPCPPAEQKPSNLHSIIYTSGTTANAPKGVLLTNQAYVCERCRQYHFIKDDMIYYSYIPMAHISERATVAVVAGYGRTIGFASGAIDTFLDDFEILHPTQFGSVPLILKAIYLKAMAAVKATGNREMVNAIFKKKLGGGSCRFCMTFGAPVSMDIVEWMTKDLGIFFTNKYGSTEVAGSTIMTPLSGELPAVGCIGYPNMLVTARLVDIPELGYSVKSNPPCGELIFKYPGEPLGYLNNPEKTKALIDEDGWMHTNDVAQVNPNGSISLVDRKDNMLKLANAKYVPVEKIESLVCLSPIISRLWIYCENVDTFLVSVVVPQFNVLALALPEGELKEQCLAIAKDPKAECAKAFCANPIIKKIFVDELQKQSEKNNLPSYWPIKGVILESIPFSEENGLMTFTSKLKRKALIARYRPQLDELYAELRKDSSSIPTFK